MNPIYTMEYLHIPIINYFIDSINSKHHLSPRTINFYTDDLTTFFHWYSSTYSDKSIFLDNNFNLDNITSDVIRSFSSEMLNPNKYKVSTINRRIKTLKRFFRWANENAFVKCNPCKSLKLLKLDSSLLPKLITTAEIEKLIEAVLKHGSLKDIAIIFMMIHTGIKSIELCNLFITDIFHCSHGVFLNVRDYDKQKTRSIPLNSDCIEALDKYLFEKKYESTYLFTSHKTKDRLGDRAIRHLVKKYMLLADLHDFSSCDLRHYFGYIMSTKVPCEKLAELMGHERLDTVMAYKNAHYHNSI